MWRSGKLPPEILSPYGVPASTDERETVVRIEGTGWRHAGNVLVSLGGVSCPVIYSGPSPLFPGQDYLAFALPTALTQRGPLSLIVETAGQRSNAAVVTVRD
jgi:uncharacterized protein (TIGR03437 family)